MTKKMTALELRERLSFANLQDGELARLKELKPALSDALGPALEVFYAKLRENLDLSSMFESRERTDVARQRQSSHWLLIADGNFDSDYLEAIDRVGKVHAKIGLEPDWYLGGYALVIDAFAKSLMEAAATQAPQKSKGFRKAAPASASADVATDIGIVVKAAMIDAGLAINAYYQVLEEERAALKATAEAEQEDRNRQLRKIEDGLTKVSEGDFSARVSVGGDGQFADMANDINTVLDTVTSSIDTVVERAELIRGGVGKISGSTGNLSDRTAQQAASLQESSAALTELSESIASTAKEAMSAAELTDAARDETVSSGQVITEANDAMRRIADSSSEIVNIVTLIDEIAFQTNLLALNASVEAARAGEAGRGFAVVAQEVRGLAQRCADAAGSIKSLVDTSEAQVVQGVGLVEKASGALEDITERIRDVSDAVGSIANAANEQATGIKQVSQAVNQMDGLTQQNATMVDETNASTQQLQREVQGMMEALSIFTDNGPSQALKKAS